MEFYGKKVKAFKIKNSIDIHLATDIEIAKILSKKEKLNQFFNISLFSFSSYI